MKAEQNPEKKPVKTRRSKGRGKGRGRTPRELPIVRPDTAGIDLAVTADIWVAVAPDREGETVRPPGDAHPGGGDGGHGGLLGGADGFAGPLLLRISDRNWEVLLLLDAGRCA
jgi:hypothetical protein